MKKIISIIVMNLCLSFLAYADDDSCTCHPYAKLSGGVNFLQIESHDEVKTCFHPGYIVSGAVGYQWCNGWHVETEYAYRRNSMKQIHYFGQNFEIPGSFQSSSYMANLLWDISIAECVLGSTHPFIGMGMGYDVQQSHASEDGFRTEKNKKGFAWQLMTGFSYPLFRCADVAFEYKFHKGPLDNFFNHVIAISFTYKYFKDDV